MLNRNSAVFNRATVPVRSERGFGLVEVMIVAAIVSILALGMSTMFSDLFRIQNKVSATTSIETFRTNLIRNIQDSAAWRATVNADAANSLQMDCLKSSTACTANTPYNVTLRDPAGNVIYDARTAANGFRKDGVLCATYPSGECPFSYTLTWTALCDGAATCINPTVVVDGVLNLAAGINVVDFMGGSFNLNKYRIGPITRGSEAIKNDGIFARYFETDASGEAGTCKGSWVTRSLSEVRDPGNGVINKASLSSPNFVALTTANQLNLKAGTYSCQIAAPGFKTGAFQIRVWNMTTGAAIATSATAIAPVTTGGFATAVIDTTFVFNGDTNIRIEQYCQGEPLDDTDGVGTTNNDFARGVPLDTGGGYATPGTTYTTVSCVRSS